MDPPEPKTGDGTGFEPVPSFDLLRLVTGIAALACRAVVLFSLYPRPPPRTTSKMACLRLRASACQFASYEREMTMNRQIPECPGPGYELVFTRTIRLKNGRVLHAESYGLKCFCFWAKARRR